MQDTEAAGRDGIGEEAIIDAAIDIVVDNGLSGLTLRPLASRLGVSVAVISARMGSKDGLIDRIVDLAAQRDQRFFARWSGLAADVGPEDTVARAAVADLAFRDWVSAGRRQAIVLVELVHHHALQRAPSPRLDRWLARASAFWSSLIFGSPVLAPALTDVALGYVLDEAGFALGAGDDPAYALLRVLCLQRLAGGGLARADGPGREIERLIPLLEPDDLPGGGPDDPKRRHIADSAAGIIVSQGMNAATHRSVALAAGVPASTVVYHFGGRAALLVAGLHAVIARFHGARDRARAGAVAPGDDLEARDLVKATSMIALASLREPSLRPHALDMRRRRGENIRAADLAALGFGPDAMSRFDRAAAQVISIALFGMRMVAMSRDLPEECEYRRGFAALDAWGDALPD